MAKKHMYFSPDTQKIYYRVGYKNANCKPLPVEEVYKKFQSLISPSKESHLENSTKKTVYSGTILS